MVVGERHIHIHYTRILTVEVSRDEGLSAQGMGVGVGWFSVDVGVGVREWGEGRSWARGEYGGFLL